MLGNGNDCIFRVPGSARHRMLRWKMYYYLKQLFILRWQRTVTVSTLQQLASKLEYRLYLTANNIHEYYDKSTLNDRVKQIVLQHNTYFLML
jgi:hypothetical protein